MKLLMTTGLLLLAASVKAAQPQCPDWLNHDLKKLHSKETVNLCQLTANKVVLIVNTASECGFTPQFKDMEALHQQYKDKGLTIIGFPSDSFNQEHKDAEKTADVCYKNYGVTFTMVATSPVKGKNANPVFHHLSKQLGEPSWNFNKYLVDRSGKPVKQFGPKTKPSDTALTSKIEELLK